MGILEEPSGHHPKRGWSKFSQNLLEMARFYKSYIAIMISLIYSLLIMIIPIKKTAYDLLSLIFAH
jgi:hypothetical protein